MLFSVNSKDIKSLLKFAAFFTSLKKLGHFSLSCVSWGGSDKPIFGIYCPSFISSKFISSSFFVLKNEKDKLYL